MEDSQPQRLLEEQTLDRNVMKNEDQNKVQRERENPTLSRINMDHDTIQIKSMD